LAFSCCIIHPLSQYRIRRINSFSVEVIRKLKLKKIKDMGLRQSVEAHEAQQVAAHDEHEDVEGARAPGGAGAGLGGIMAALGGASGTRKPIKVTMARDLTPQMTLTTIDGFLCALTNNNTNISSHSTDAAAGSNVGPSVEVAGMNGGEPVSMIVPLRATSANPNPDVNKDAYDFVLDPTGRKLLIVCGEPNKMYTDLYNLETHSVIWSLSENCKTYHDAGEDCHYFGFVFNNAGTRIASCFGENHSVAIWEAELGLRMQVFRFDHVLWCISYSFDDKALLLGLALEDSCLVINSLNGDVTANLSIDGDCKKIVSGAETCVCATIPDEYDNKVVCWDYDSGTKICETRGRADEVCFARNDAILVFSKAGGGVDLWDIGSNSLLGTIVIQMERLIYNRFSNMLMVVAKGNEVQVYNMSSEVVPVGWSRELCNRKLLAINCAYKISMLM
jgi:hypothetical protein